MKWQWKIKKLWRKLILSFLRVVKYKLYRYEKIQQDYRHKVVAEYVTSHRPVLDAGGTKSANLGLYIPNEVVTVNKAKICEPDIIADVCCLPIKPKSFNTVVAIQIFHQIPQDERECMIGNLRTVARKKIILHDYQKGYFYKGSSSFEDLKKIMPSAYRRKLNFPFMLIMEEMR